MGAALFTPRGPSLGWGDDEGGLVESRHASAGWHPGE
jgi:hypothetical protein